MINIRNMCQYKNCTFLLLLILLPLVHKGQGVIKKSLIGIEVTSNMLKLDPKESYDYNQALKNKISFPFELGVVSSFYLTKRLLFETGLRYTTIKTKSVFTIYDNSISNYEIKEDFYSTLKLNKLSIPIRISYDIGLSESLSISPIIESVNSIKLNASINKSMVIENQFIDGQWIFNTYLKIRETLGDEIYSGIFLNKRTKNEHYIRFFLKYALIKLKADYTVLTYNSHEKSTWFDFDVNNYFSFGLIYSLSLPLSVE